MQSYRFYIDDAIIFTTYLYYTTIYTPVHYSAMLIHDFPRPGLLQNLRWGPPRRADGCYKAGVTSGKRAARHRDEARS